jgi:hypothetical protein
MRLIINACHVLYFFPFSFLAVTGFLDAANILLGGHGAFFSIDAAVIAMNVGILGCIITFHIAGPLFPGASSRRRVD